VSFLSGSPVVVELGPGTGSFAAAIQRRVRDGGRRIAVEVNPRFAQDLAARHPAVDVALVYSCRRPRHPEAS